MTEARVEHVPADRVTAHGFLAQGRVFLAEATRELYARAEELLHG